ncbi:putative receptor-like protein kinase At3g47110 [Salvia hispanica]|uniref:putative receptor-like protein kinase At3g47110 n=1 Tax=Salvia hispanica TaxID=49212 RepID=UPI0020096E79|nr:putative receptor-like protein kinase At3g47110 [Salvia hispanica]
METSILSFALPIIFLSSFTFSLNSNTTDKHALITFKNSITSDPNAILSTKWSQNISVCNWVGVSCGLKHGRVTALNLSGYGLSGTVAPHLGNLTFLRYLDISFNSFVGKLPFELSKLRRLKVMNVGVNSFTGEIPTWLGSLPQLQKLYMYNNTFLGTIPTSLFNNSKLQMLQILNLNNNQLSGSIPNGISYVGEVRIGNNSLSGWLPSDMCSNMSNIELLELDLNGLEGDIPPNIWKCKNLQIFSLSENNFSGNIPQAMGNVSMLRVLSLGYNHFTGHIPSNIWNCRHLEYMAVLNNNLSGNISHAIGNTSTLRHVYLSDNHFTGELPQEIGTLPILEVLDVFRNLLHGSIPFSIFNISTLQALQISGNEFSGTLSSDFGSSLPNLQWLLLAKNKLSGLIPTSITNASNLIGVDMHGNSFSGYIPYFGSLKLLQRLLLWENNLSAAKFPSQELIFLSSLTNCPNLQTLDVSYNPLNGILPTSFGNFSSSLRRIDISYCNIMGDIPSGIANFSSLLVLNLAINQLGGTIPPTIGKLNQLQGLYLTGNQLVGFIPNDLCQLNHLGELFLSVNMLVGPIPECLGDVKSLRVISFFHNQLNSSIPSKFWALTDLVKLSLSTNYLSGNLSSELGNLKLLTSLDLSSNQFSGDIPTLIDGCQTLDFLNLSQNLLSGSIPQSVGKVKGLRTLDLSYNYLSGSIPKSLEDLPFLENFNVSNNKLEGKIPDGGNFRNFSALSFSHNLALCGPITFQVPPCQEKHHRSWLKKAMVTLGVLAVIVVIATLVLMRMCKKKKVTLSVDTSPLTAEYRRVPYIELVRGTSSFSETNLLGKGSFGSVFEAILSDGLKVAVKVFNLDLQGATKSFDAETTILSNIRHRNLVRVIGCCCNMEFKALILTFMPNGSLDKWLHSDMYGLDLIQRLKIAIDVAAALEYLHHGHTFPVVHCDIKPSNVLLDQDMTAHLADFGISKLFDEGETVIQTQTVATIGYAAPEFGSEGKVSTNGDVFSFGILLLEMFTGKNPTNDMFGEERSIKEWVSEALEKSAVTEIVPHAMLSIDDQHFSAKKQCFLSIFELAMKCSAVSAEERIDMIEAAAALRKIYATLVAGTESRRPLHPFPVSIRNNRV